MSDRLNGVVPHSGLCFKFRLPTEGEWYLNPQMPEAAIVALLEDPKELNLIRLAIGKRGGHKKLNAIADLCSRGLIWNPTEEPVEETETGHIKSRDRQNIAQGLSKKRLGADPLLTSFDAIELEQDSYLWEGRLVMGSLNLIMGDPGQGKSTFLGSLMAMVTTGGVLPDSGNRLDPGCVLVIQKEESRGGPIRRRLENERADMSRVINFDGFMRGEKKFSLIRINLDFDAIEQTVERIPDLKLVVIDPITTVFSGAGLFNEGDVREALTPLLELAEKKRFCIVATIQFNKNFESPLLYRAANSAAFMQIARMVWFVSEDPRDKRKRMFTFVKGNPHDRIETGLSWHMAQNRLTWERRPVKFSGQQVDSAIQKNRQVVPSALAKACESAVKKKIARLILEAVAHQPMPLLAVVAEVVEQLDCSESMVRRELKRLTDDQSEHYALEKYLDGTNKRGKPQTMLRTVETTSPNPVPCTTELAVFDSEHDANFKNWLRNL